MNYSHESRVSSMAQSRNLLGSSLLNLHEKDMRSLRHATGAEYSIDKQPVGEEWIL
jgi:hypothetical protein